MPQPSHHDLIAALAREPLRHIVLLKQLLAWPEHVAAHRVTGAEGSATLVMLDAAASPWDRQTYPKARIAAFIASDHPALTARLLAHVPASARVVFKLASEADRAAVARQFALERRTAFVSFTASERVEPDLIEPDRGVHFTRAPGDRAFALFATQGHDREWLEPMLGDGRAFACVLEHNDRPLAVCFAFENYGPVWEVGGVVTDPGHLRQGLAARVVRTALAELGERGLMPRYQVEEDNTASIALARSVGLRPFVTLTHWAHGC
ncbi:MAG: GNAT family N-acetyltransferase [Reyranella sp.]|uniref:GNAT family N-acetyltransferase n=1 Tax=Reyranella sp. TaxID=1929291 RepID=UPI001ACEB1E7|nr:GNAT family N-acetyltransferase [Reyranella sp.]MBN9086379.1 GNAT family N-acetyltransferase [Reyranella sp.]